MGSDRARVSYDPKQQYRSVVMQQGRVTLEADWNEAQQITGEETRNEALDFVGPCGTPDDGYSIVLTQSPTNPPYDFYVQPGTMYVGGIRASLLDPVQYSNQPDWQDYGPEDPDWVSLSSLAQAPPTDEFVYLYLREQEVSAVEDPDLKDIALGGPDTAQRTRILQRIARVRCSGTDCVSGLDAAEAQWTTEGLVFDADTMRLTSWSTLSVGPSSQLPVQTPCQPQAQGGYVDPDNQLIRVQISGIDPITGNPKFLWGFDDASFLYRINIDPNNPQNLILQSAPVDSAHQPVQGQAVEVLRTAAELPNGADVAALSGFVFTLDSNYNPDSQSVVVPTGLSLPADYVASNFSPSLPLFLRVWQQEVVFTPGTPATLGDTGLAVTIDITGNQPFHLGDYWLFAVRPATPQMVYPERYWSNQQRPEGPRLWACPLGVIAWSNEVGRLVSDCRNQFDNLVNLSKRQQGCCTITVTPQDLSNTKTLQTILDMASHETMLVMAANPGAAGNNIQIQFSNFQLNATPPTFDMTVTETDIYLGQTTAAIEGVIGDDEGGPNSGLAHILTGSVNTSLAPLNNQTVTLTAGTASLPAQANIMDTTNQQLVFTLQARNPGVDGNLTQATISNVQTGSPDTFALTVTWTKTVTGLNMGTLQNSIQAQFGYEIVASAPAKVSASLPAEGVTTLSGGADASEGTNATTASALIFGNPTTICLRPGSYKLTNPLVLGPEHSNITIESCGGGTTISAAAGFEINFVQGLIQLNNSSNITFRGLTFALPQFLLFQANATLGGLNREALRAIGEASLFELNTSVGLMVSGCNGLQIEDCIFNYPALQLNDVLIAYGILANADCANVTLQGNVFNGPASVSAMTDTTGNTLSGAIANGYVQAYSASFGGTTGEFVPSSLDNIVVSDNYFQNLTYPVVISTVIGQGRFDGNTVKSCVNGFMLLPLSLITQATTSVGLQKAPAQVQQAVLNPTLQRTINVATLYPRSQSFMPQQTILIHAAQNAAVNPAPVVNSATTPALNKAGKPATNVMQRVVNVFRSQAAAAGENAPVAEAPPARKTETLTTTIGSLVGNLQEIGIISFSPGLLFSIQISNNHIEAVVAEGGSQNALLVTNQGFTSGAGTALGILMLTGNDLRNASQAYTVLAMVDRCIVTGNQIMNNLTNFISTIVERGGPSLYIDLPTSQGTNAAEAAVTGNIIQGPAILPPRTAATPALPDWITYNLQL
ncbi:MAG TPA: DUF6519 domain-containing protein [Pseudacidobacterium sp.]|jgi:hypothetical protein|nr:DUF6519 domain-containing protein [Pseudacidobacterium sp.]